MKKYFDLLGYPLRDKVTGYAGVGVSLSFDLYGCVQVFLAPPVNGKGEVPEGRWADVSRLVKTSKTRVMEPPAHFADDHGPAEKSAPR